MPTTFNSFGNFTFPNLGSLPSLGGNTGPVFSNPLPGGTGSGGTTTPIFDVNTWLSSFGGLYGGGIGSGTGGSSGGASGGTGGSSGGSGGGASGGTGGSSGGSSGGTGGSSGGSGSGASGGSSGNGTPLSGTDVDGSGGNSYIVGTEGNDRLNGGWNDPYASDTVIGAGGNDKIAGGKGDQANDVLTGGSGADTFYFGSYGDDGGYYQGFGRDTITDFNPWEGDRINVVAVHDVNKASWGKGGGRPYDSFDVYNDGANTYVDVYANAGDHNHGLAGTIVLQNIVLGAKELVENYIIAWPNPEYADF